MRRALMLSVVLALAALAGPAQGQRGASITLFGGPPGAKIVSETNIPAQVQGDVVVSFRGDAAAGCVTYGLCAYSGTIVVRPRSGQLGVVTYRRRGRIGHSVFVGLGSPENGYVTAARVTRSAAGAPAGTCADAAGSLSAGEGSASVVHGAMLTIRLLARDGSLLETRCAGPRDGDLSSASPAVTVPLARVLRGRIALDLSGTRTFAGHGFAGTITSTVALKLGKPSSQSEQPAFPPGIMTHRVRTVVEQLRLVRVQGRLTTTVRGTGDPIVCGLLDSCGLGETLSLRGGVPGALAQVIATGPARRPYADFLAALGLSRSGHPRGIAVLGTVEWVGRVGATASQSGSVCTDAAVTGAVAMPFGLEGSSGGFAGSWRTRCPGPSLSDARLLVAGSLDRSALGHRQFTIEARGTGTSADDGYVFAARGRLSLVLRRGRITQQAMTQPTG